MSAPEAAAPYAARQNGEYLVVDKGASLPGVCIKCGRTDGLHGRSHTFQSFDPALYLAFLVSGALALILLLWVRPKRGTLEFPICDACDRRWRRASGVWTVALLWLFVWSFVAYTLLGLGAVAAFLVLEIIAVIPAALVRWTVSEWYTVVAIEINDEQLSLAGVHETARQAIVAGATPPKPLVEPSGG